MPPTVYRNCPCSDCKNEVLLAPRTIRRHVQLNGRMRDNWSNKRKSTHPSSHPSESLRTQVEDTLRRVAMSESFERLFGDILRNRQQAKDQCYEVFHRGSGHTEVDGDLISTANGSNQSDENHASASSHAEGHASDSNNEPYRPLMESGSQTDLTNDSIQITSDTLESAENDQQCTDESLVEIEDILGEIECEEYNPDPSGLKNATATDHFHQLLSKPQLERWVLMFITCFQETFNASNREMNSLLRFLRLILKFVSKNPTQDIDYAVPLTVETVRSRAGVAKDNFQKYVGCPKCHTQYLFDEHCPHNCSHVEFPNHPRPSFRKPCGASLFTQVRKPNVEEPIQVPRKIYPMNDVAETLASFLRRPGFENLIDHWKKRSLSKEILGDVYDGRVSYSSSCLDRCLQPLF